MKKFFAILAVVALASCGEAKQEEKPVEPGTSTPETETSAAAKIDTTKTADGTKDSLYTIKGGKADGTDSVWQAAN